MARGAQVPAKCQSHNHGDAEMDVASRLAMYMATNSEFTISRPSQLIEPVSRYLQ